MALGGTKQITQLIGAFACKHTFLTRGRGARNRSDLRSAVLIATQEFKGQGYAKRKCEQRAHVFCYHLGGINSAVISTH